MKKVHKRQAEHTNLVDVWHVWCHMSPLVKEFFKTDEKWLSESPSLRKIDDICVFTSNPWNCQTRWCLLDLCWRYVPPSPSLCSPALHLSHIYIFQISVLIFRLIAEIFAVSTERQSRDKVHSRLRLFLPERSRVLHSIHDAAQSRQDTRDVFR